MSDRWELQVWRRVGLLLGLWIVGRCWGPEAGLHRSGVASGGEAASMVSLPLGQEKGMINGSRKHASSSHVEDA